MKIAENFKDQPFLRWKKSLEMGPDFKKKQQQQQQQTKTKTKQKNSQTSCFLREKNPQIWVGVSDLGPHTRPK